jgi:hypothetical protein
MPRTKKLPLLPHNYASPPVVLTRGSSFEPAVRDCPISDQTNKLHPALKHGGYSATSVLPGERRADFEKLHRDLIAELVPTGALEDNIVATIARLTWRKQNLAIFRIAEHARDRQQQIIEIGIGRRAKDDAAVSAKVDAVFEVRKELGDAYELVEIGDAATINGLLSDLEIEERMDALIDKCLKRLLFVRGLKSISTTSSSAPQQRIADHTKAA